MKELLIGLTFLASVQSHAHSIPKKVLATKVETIIYSLSENPNGINLTLKEDVTEDNIGIHIPFSGRGGDPRFVDTVITYEADYDVDALSVLVNNPEDGQTYSLKCKIVSTESEEAKRDESAKYHYSVRLYGCYISSNSPAAAFDGMDVDANFHQYNDRLGKIGLTEWTSEKY